MSGYDTPNDALVATYDALERTTQLAAAPEFNRAVLQHSKSHPRMLDSKTRPDSPLLRSIISGKNGSRESSNYKAIDLRKAMCR